MSEVHVLFPATRAGKDYDTVDQAALAHFAPGAFLSTYTNEADIATQLRHRGIRRVITNDAAHHYPTLCTLSDIDTYSISVFIDSLHYAWRVKRGESKKYVPRKTYFPSAYIERKFFNIGSYTPAELPSMTLGAPQFDHTLFLDQARPTPAAPAVLYIAPPPELLSPLMMWRIKRLFRAIKEQGFRLIVKDRAKTPLPAQLARWCDEHHTSETILPYASLTLLNQASLHICGYSTSVFEARLLNKPTLNIEIDLSRHQMGNFIVTYGLDDLYTSRTCLTARKNFTPYFNRLISLPLDAFSENDRFLAPRLPITLQDNASLRILRDIAHDEAPG